MEQEPPRKKYAKALHSFCELVELDEPFMEALEKHPNNEYIEEFSKFGKSADLDKKVSEKLQQDEIDYIKNVMKNNSDMAKKGVIFLEFTRERSTCDEMVKILRECGQKVAADKLENYNSSPRFMPLSYEEKLPVKPATVLRSGKSKWVEMERKPRGMFIIINNVKNDLENESLRFKNIGEQLSFVVEDFYDMSAKQMNDKLTQLSKDKTLIDGDALIVMIISHGYEEKICGADDSEIKMTEILDIFSDVLKEKPKLFFFNCCRKNKQLVHKRNVLRKKINKYYNQIVNMLKSFDQDWINKHKKTMVCFACSEGYPAFYDKNGFTYFGQALSHCIAQYACDKSVQSIMNLTAQRCKEFGEDSVYGWIRPETSYFDMTREFYFNPGLPI